MYYNAAITHWLNLTADLQIINPGLTKTLNGSGGQRPSTPQLWPEPAFASASSGEHRARASSAWAPLRSL